MGYSLQNSGIRLRKPRQIFRTKQKIFKFYLNLFILASFLISIPLHFKRAMAIETVKASALNLEDARDDLPLSYSPQNPPASHGQIGANDDPCLPLLSLKNGLPLKASFDMHPHMAGRPGQNTREYFNQRPVDVIHKTAAPAALSFLLGVRIALDPNKAAQNGKRVQLTSNIQPSFISGQNPALSIAAYRSCKNALTLSMMR